MLSNKELVERADTFACDYSNPIILGTCTQSKTRNYKLSKEQHQMLSEFCVLCEKAEAEYQGFVIKIGARRIWI